MISKIKQIMEDYPTKPLGNYRHYAVMIPLIQVDQDWHLLYEVRSKKISQPGETSFPGGRHEEGETFRQTAIRETCEELNLQADQVEIFGSMEYIVSESRIIHTYVGQLKVGLDVIEPNEEVAEVFTVPLQYFLDHEPAYYSITPTSFNFEEDFPIETIPGGRDYKFRAKHTIPFYDLEDHDLWGFTANMTHRFSEIIKENGLGKK